MDENAKSVRCMLLPLSGLNLLIPNSAVAEIVGYTEPREIAGSSDWFPGVVLWRGVYIPVVTIEELCGRGVAGVGPRTRIAIVYNPEKDSELPYLGIHIQDIPRAYLAEADTMIAGGDQELSEFLLAGVDDEELARAIPDLDKIIATLKLEYSQEKLDQLTH